MVRHVAVAVAVAVLSLISAVVDAAEGLQFDTPSGEFTMIDGGEIPAAGTISCEVEVEDWYSSSKRWAPAFMIILADAADERTARLSVSKGSDALLTYRVSVFLGSLYEHNFPYFAVRPSQNTFAVIFSWDSDGTINARGEDIIGQYGQAKHKSENFKPATAKIHISGMKGVARCATDAT